MEPLSNKIILITGAKGGLGSFVTQAVLDSGGTAIGVSRSIKAEDFRHERFVAMAAEMNSAEAARGVVERVVAEHGRLDGVIHLVGGFDMGPRVEESTDAVFDKMLDINFRTALHLFQAVIPQLRKQGYGALAAVGSKAAVDPSALTAAYNVSKAALVSLVRTVAAENKDAGISANVVLPGTMDTPANRAAMPAADPAKWVQPAQVANVLAYLMSGGAAQMTGAVIPVYGVAG